MFQAISGVAHAHAHRVVHRDIKPANLLVDPATGALKVRVPFCAAAVVVHASWPWGASSA